MKRYITMMLLLLLALMPVSAQQNNGDRRHHFDPQAFKMKQDAFIREKACLSQAEAEKVFPIFHELKEKQWGLNRKVWELKRKQPCQTDSKECATIVSQITALNVEIAKLEQTYFAKMCKVVDAKKVLSVMQADDAFHREMLRNAGPRGGGKRGPRDDMHKK